MSIKSVLTNAGRYDDVMTLLDSIIKNEKYKTASYPLFRPMVRNNVTLWRVDAKSVIQQAMSLRDLIESEVDIDVDMNFDELFAYVSSESDTMLHNYAIIASHRDTPDESLLEEIRILCIINGFLMYKFCCKQTISDYAIPPGWAKL